MESLDRGSFVRRRVRVALALSCGLALSIPVAGFTGALGEVQAERRRLDAEIAVECARLSKLRLPCLDGDPLDGPGRERIEEILPCGRVLLLENRNWLAVVPIHADMDLSARGSFTVAGSTPWGDMGFWPLDDALHATRVTPRSFEIVDSDASACWRGLSDYFCVEALYTSPHDERSGLEVALDGARLALALAVEGGTGRGPLVDALVAAELEANAFRLMAEMLALDRGSSELRARVARGLDLLDAARPTAAEIWHQHGLALRKAMLQDDGKGLDLSGRARWLPKPILLVRGLYELEALLDLDAPARDAKSLLALDAAIDSFNGHVHDAWNPYLRKLGPVPHSSSFRESADAEARLRAALLPGADSKGP
jgi:hypothetical protein